MALKKLVIMALLLTFGYGLFAQGGSDIRGLFDRLFGRGGSSSEAPSSGGSPAPNTGGTSTRNTGGSAVATAGRLTITNIPAKYNGKFIAMPGAGLDNTGKDVIIGYGDITNAGVVLAGRIQNGRAELKVWRADGSTELKNFNMTVATHIMLGIYQNQDFTAHSTQLPTAMADATVNFRNGVGTVSGAGLQDLFSF